MGNALQGDQFQCFSMVTETGSNGDQVYLVGFREDEEVHLFSVETRDANKYGELTKAGTYKGWDGSDWRTGGVALQIVDSSTVRILATGKDPHGSTDEYSIDLYVWGE